MSLVVRMRRQTAVYWALASNESGGLDQDQYGRPGYTDPVEIDCRWEDTVTEYVRKDGSTQTSGTRVFVDRDMKVGELLMLGTLDDVLDLEDPRANDNFFEIKGFQKTPDLKARATGYLRLALL
jgi:hypothetical protein